jgi:hypothetical protein
MRPVVVAALAGLVLGCTAMRPPATAPHQPIPSQNTTTEPAPANASPSAAPTPGSAEDWDQKLNDAFGPIDPAFTHRGADAQPTPLPTPEGQP